MVTFKVRNEWRCRCKYDVDTPSAEDYLAACGLNSEECTVAEGRVLRWSDDGPLPMDYTVEADHEPDSEVLETAEAFMWDMWLFKHLDYSISRYGTDDSYTIDNQGMRSGELMEKLEELRKLCITKERTNAVLEVLCHDSKFRVACIALILDVPVSEVYEDFQQPSCRYEDSIDDKSIYNWLLDMLLNVLLDDKDAFYKWESICFRLAMKVKERNTDLSKIKEYCLALQKAYDLAIDAYVSIDGTREEWSEFMNANADIWENNRYAINRACCSAYSSSDYTGLLATCYAIGLPKLEGLEVPEGTRTMLDIDSEYFHGLYGLSVRTYDFTKLLDVPKSSIAECKTKEDLMELVERYCK